MNRTQVWSCGGGVQSTAIAGLIVEGKLPRPDIACIADTGHEKSATWDYLRTVTAPALAAIGVEVQIVSAEEYRYHDLTKSNDILLPVYTTQSGRISKLPTYCSTEWKRRVIQRWLRAQGVKQCDVWLGMSLDEFQRIKDSAEQWYAHVYPLVYQIPMRRGQCVEYVTETLGWPMPPRSACYMCPNMADREWRELKTSDPAGFAAAVAMEVRVRAIDPHAWLHKSCVPLSDVDFDAQGDLFAGEDADCKSGYCFV